MSTDTPRPRALIGWSETFAAFERNLNEWLTRAVEVPSAPVPPSAPMPSQLFEERLKRLQTYLDQAERNAEQALAPLTSEIQALRQWLEALNMARAKLVERTVRAV